MTSTQLAGVTSRAMIGQKARKLHYKQLYALRTAPLHMPLTRASFWPTNQHQAFSVAMWMRLDPVKKAVGSDENSPSQHKKTRSFSFRRHDVTSSKHHRSTHRILVPVLC